VFALSTSIQKNQLTIRSFSKLPHVLDVPNLLAVQLDSFAWFLQQDESPSRRKNQGLQAVFQEIFPISDPRDNFSLEFVEYTAGRPKYKVDECQERDMTYAAPLKARLRLVIKEGTNGKKDIRDIVEQEVYLGEIPLITEKGTFIINGAERVIVSQLHRSPGVFFDDEIHPNGKRLYSARIIPYRGSWVEFSLDINDIMYVHIDRKRKLPVTVLLRALGYNTNEDILRCFCEMETINLGKGKRTQAPLVGRICGHDVVDPASGEVLVECGEEITEASLQTINNAALDSVDVLVEGEAEARAVLLNTLRRDTSTSTDDALKRIYNVLRPGDPPNVEGARGLLDRLFFNPRRYDLAPVGRYKLNQRLGLDVPTDRTVLCTQDFVAIVAYLMELHAGNGFTDDIDHLGNRRIRSVGELLANQFSVGLSRMARIIRERMGLQDAENMTPSDLVNARTISAVIKTFFGSSQLSQFMDQTNPLAELTHKRRLSALGPGGLSRERAGFEVRDVHHTHYGRMCPVETPEGPNIGLISSLSTYARVNEFGFLETPYRRVAEGRATDEIHFLSADQGDRLTIAQANTRLGDGGKILEEQVACRHRGDFPVIPPDQVDYMDVSPKQLVSAAAALIPFLEHDDANRALMGSNMQRQAVPLLRTERPLVGTGMEEKVAQDSGAVVVAARAGKVESVTADQIKIRVSDGQRPDDLFGTGDIDVYKLTKFRRSNQDTCINQRPIVTLGQRVKRGEPIADGPATDRGGLALGVNLLVAFMPWRGYNFEDAVLVSERVVRDDGMTSIHIEEFECQVRDTKRGAEEVTREIPNVSEEALRNLDDYGIIRIGARVRSGDILVGKVTPKGETELSPEERLLRAIFGEKAGDVRDASLKAPPGMDGIVIDIRVFSRRERDERTKREEKKNVDLLRRNAQRETERVRSARLERLSALLDGRVARRVVDWNGNVVVKEGKAFTEKILKELDFDTLDLYGGVVDDATLNRQVNRIMDAAKEAIEEIERQTENQIDNLTRGDELAPGVVKLVKVFVARKRKLSVGDKVAGRHGNKGVVAKILAEEDMPFLPDGRPVDLVLNPLGVPSRMNLGQILETHLGWAAEGWVSTPRARSSTVPPSRRSRAACARRNCPSRARHPSSTGERVNRSITRSRWGRST
jgi:DNA-directed RNA polymerase subunit beta